MSSESESTHSPNVTQSQSLSLSQGSGTKVTTLSNLFEDWFLDYASYVILERAVPALPDGLKPVQRRILHSLREMDDGRYNKVANVIGNTLKYHPHGDASIGDALVQLGQKELLIDMQGNWGNILTGDSAAAPRYIEARLSKFAREVVFSPKITQYVKSYDGRNDEPVYLPIKFPLLLAQGADGIAVGMACKILPHNFNEILTACVCVLKNEPFELYPDFQTGGLIDVSQYNDGLRGGKVRVRAKMKIGAKSELIITEIPYGTTTSSLIESIVKASEKGKIKIKKVEDNTSEHAEIVIHLPSGVSPDKTIDALYAFTDAEISISPNASVIAKENPMFLGVSELLKESVQHTVSLLQQELELQLRELSEAFYFLHLEKLFIENKIYIDFDGRTYEEAKALTLERLLPLIAAQPAAAYREITSADIEKLLEIKMRRITQHDVEEADLQLKNLQEKMDKVRYYLAHLIDYAVAYFQHLKKEYGKGKERKTEIRVFDVIAAKEVVQNNKKLYIDNEEGFIGFGLKKGNFVCECSDIDDILILLKDGKLLITPIAEKKFVGKNIVYAGIWRKTDTRRVYHLIYRDGEKGSPMAKRFYVKAITRDKIYDLTRGTEGTQVLYFSAQPNGEKEVVSVHLHPIGGLKKLEFDYDFSVLPIRTLTTLGQKVTNRSIKNVVQKEVGASTLAAQPLWLDTETRRLNKEGRGQFVGDFKAEDKLFCLYKSGFYQVVKPELTLHFQEDLLHLSVFDAANTAAPLCVLYFDAERAHYFIKRFIIEEAGGRKVRCITENEQSYIVHFSLKPQAKLKITFAAKQRGGAQMQQNGTWESLTELKTLQALGKDLGDLKITKVE